MQVIPYSPQADPYSYLSQGLGNLFGGLQGQYMQGLLGQDIAGMQQPGYQPQHPLAQQMMLQNMLTPITPTQLLNQWRLNKLQGMTPEKQEQYMLKPPISVTMPTGQALLTPDQRIAQAKAEHKRKLAEKRLTPTDLKSIRDTIKEIVGEAKALPFGLKPGYALKQSDMNAKWESAMESTGYDALDKVAQKQIENEFDRYVQMLNKGKGAGVLARQYQWDRRKYGIQEKTQRTTPEMDDVEKGIRQVLAKVDSNVMNKIYEEAPKLRPIWERLSEQEKITAYEKLAEGFTAQEIISHFTGKR